MQSSNPNNTNKSLARSIGDPYILSKEKDGINMYMIEKHGLGSWIGGFVDEWTWNYNKLESLETEQLKELINIIDEAHKRKRICN